MIRVKDLIKLITYLCVLLSFFAVFPYLEKYHAAAFLLLLVPAVYLDYRKDFEIPRWILNSLSVAVLILTAFRITPEFLIEPILDSLVILAGIKLVEDKKFRDYMQIYVICTFLLVGSTLISLSIVFLLYFSTLLILVTVSLILLTYFAQDPELSISRLNLVKIAHQSLLIFLVSLPIGLLLFFILPRTNFPFLSFLTKSSFARSGFTDTIRLGEVSEIQEDNAVIFRAEMDPVDERMLYWRGVVLDHFDGVRWRSTQDPIDSIRHNPEGVEILQTIYLEPYGNRFLFALDRPISFSVFRKRNFSPLSSSPKGLITQRLKYKAQSIASPSLPQQLIDRDRYLQLPDTVSDRIKGLVRQLRHAGSDRVTVGNMLRFFRQGDFMYSLDNLPVSGSPLDDFLFTSRSGNCEYFASGLAVMLRVSGIPARLVGGYKGGVYNAPGKYYLVTQRNAHVWVEAYLSRDGWLRLDPTPAPPTPGPTGAVATFIQQLKVILDTFNYYWFKLIIGYDFSRQMEILQAIHARLTHPEISINFRSGALPLHLALALGAIALLASLYWAIQYRPSPSDRLLTRFLRKMAHHGFAKAPGEGLEELVSRVPESDLKQTAWRFVQEFQRVYYRDMPFTKERLRTLRQHLKEI